MMYKHSFSPFLAAALLITALSASSCGASAELPADTNPVPSGTEPLTEAVTEAVENPAPDLPERDYGGDSFVFLNGNTSYSYCKIVIDGESGDAVNDALFRRNTKIAERYNVTFEEIPSNAVTNDAMKSIQSGDDAFDMALMHCEDALAVTLQNGAVDYADIPHLDLSREWWLRQTLDTMSLEGHHYFGVSMFDISHFESTRALFFNKRIIEENDLTSPYELVHNGTWTIDKLKEYGLAAIRDLNGDGAWTNDDRYAFSSSANVGAPALMIGMNAPLRLNKDENDLPFFNLDSEYYMDRLNKLTETLFCDDHFLIKNFKEDADFIGGHCLFYSNLITHVVNMRDMEDDFGIITQPKYTEDQDTYYNYGGSPFYMVIPQTAKDLERTGILMEDLAYESMGVTDTAYYDVLLQGKISRDAESRNMLDMIFSSLCYQIPVAQKYVQTDLCDQHIWKNKTDFASYFEKNREKIQNEIDKAVEAFTAGD